MPLYFLSRIPVGKAILTAAIAGGSLGIVERVAHGIYWNESVSSLIWTGAFLWGLHSIFFLLTTVPILAFLSFILQKLGRTSVLEFLILGGITGAFGSLLFAIIMKLINGEHCDAVCLDPGTYFPFIYTMIGAGLIQGFVFWLLHARKV